eukprot:52657-Hanusia_phi.AAC.1
MLDIFLTFVVDLDGRCDDDLVALGDNLGRRLRAWGPRDACAAGDRVTMGDDSVECELASVIAYAGVAPLQGRGACCGRLVLGRSIHLVPLPLFIAVPESSYRVWRGFLYRSTCVDVLSRPACLPQALASKSSVKWTCRCGDVRVGPLK